MSREWDIFIAYASPDGEIAEALADELELHGSVFLASRQIHPGDEWDNCLRTAVASSKIFVVLVSPSSDEAFFQRDEILRAIDLAREKPPKTRVIPVYIRETSPQLAEIPYGLIPKQALILKDLSKAAQIARQIADLLHREDDQPVESRSFSPGIRDYLATLKKDVDELTQEQYRTIQQIRTMRRVRISGSAGSGKTLVAAEKASRMAGAGLRVLFLCHNPLLAAHAKNLTIGKGVEVAEFCGWIARAIESANTPHLPNWSHYQEPDEESLRLAAKKFAAPAAKYDAIIIDEAQDFRDGWWAPVEAALRSEDSSLYIFHDNNQSLIPHLTDYPVLDPHIDLSRNCRNAGKIFELMRCFNSASPSGESRLREKGRVALHRFQPGQECSKLTSILRVIYRDGMIEETVVLWLGPDEISGCPIANLDVELSTAGSWQEEVRHQFDRILNLYDSRGVSPPPDAERRVGKAFSKLSLAAEPTDADVSVVREIANSFSITQETRSAIANSPLHRAGFQWQQIDSRLKLRRKASGLIWAAEPLIHFSTGHWHRGIPKADCFRIIPFFEPRANRTIPLYNVSDFKGLEADVVILVMRGRSLNPLQSLYVGISRARVLLTVMADSTSLDLLPRTFQYDHAE